MPPPTTHSQGMELGDYVRNYEASQARGEATDLGAFLPERGHPLYAAVLRELVRIDLEYGWEQGRPRSLEDYQRSFPELFGDRESLQEISFEEYRLRRRAGENPTPAEYERRFGVDTKEWPGQSLAAGGPAEPARQQASPAGEDALPQAVLLAEAALAYQELRQRQAGPGGVPGQLSWEGFGGSLEYARVFEELHSSDPFAAERLAQAVTAMSRAGREFLDFHLLAELGRGAFGRVYLAQQGELANRLVVLKIAPNLGESQALAQLQHTHIVPIYSVHRTGPFQAVCMPYFGATTLADVIRDLRGRPAPPDSGKYLLDRIEARALEIHRTVVGVPAPPSPRAPVGRLTYVEAVLWAATRLADGLAHAHERGILHLDLKPANILMTDEGQPMLLDFNLSEDTKLPTSMSAARIGGTLPYMAPEQMEAFRGGTQPVDGRSDLYAFGVVLYELLTGRNPFVLPRGPVSDVLPRLIADRLGSPPLLRRCNSAVSPAVESIVRHCLEPDPGRRYQTAQELREDLQRQLEHRPLKYAPEPSLWERGRKWARRHPRLTSSTGVGVAAALLVLILASAFLLRLNHLSRSSAEQAAERTRLEAVASLNRLHEDLKTVQALLGNDVLDAEPEQREEGMALARQILDRYQVLETSPWQETPLVRALSPEQRRQLQEEMGELLLLFAKATARQGQLDFSLRLNALAEGCYPEDAVPQALWRQRAELTRLAGRADEAQRLLEKADSVPLRSPRDRYLLLLTNHQDSAQLREVLPILREASRREKDNFSVWLILGNCYAGLGKPAEAVACYDLASALWPEAHWPYLHRGLVHLGQRDYRQAGADFDQVIRLRPDLRQAYYNRALARYHLDDLAGARADLTHLLEEREPSLRAYFLRARVRDKEGDRAGAQQDREEGLRREPRDERDWTARGLARAPRDPKAALADYNKALEINPRYRTALQNKASVLSERLGRTEEAIEVLDKVLALYPDYVPARAGRGVLLARLGRREAAHADAKESLERDTKPITVYQVAGIYALTSKQSPDDRREAFRLLASALRQGFGFELLDKDRDLDSIRDQPEFRRLVEASRALRTAGPSQGPKP